MGRTANITYRIGVSNNAHDNDEYSVTHIERIAHTFGIMEPRGHWGASADSKMEQHERRRERRFLVREPALVRVSREDLVDITAISENLSTSGVLLRSASFIPRHSRINVRVQLPTGAELRAFGVVSRVESSSTGGYFSIAVKCDRPFEPFPFKRSGDRIV